MNAVVGLTEDMVLKALIGAKGDLIQTGLALGLGLGKLHSFIRNVPRVRLLYTEMEKLRRGMPEDEFDQLSADRFRDEIDARTACYQLEGLEVIHELATTPHESAMMAEVRLKAAMQLRGASTGQGGSLVALMNDLNAAYQASAGTVKGLRASATLHLTVEAPAEPESIPRIETEP
jgi:hypothetical protein